MTCIDQLSQEGMQPQAQTHSEEAIPEGLTAEGWLASALPAAGTMGSSLNLAGHKTGHTAGHGVCPSPHLLLTEIALQSVNHHD